MKVKKDRIGYQFVNKDGDLMEVIEYSASTDFYAINTRTGVRYHGCNWTSQVEGQSLGSARGFQKKSTPSLEDVWANASPEERNQFFANRFSIPQKKFELFIPGTEGDEVIYTFSITKKQDAKKLLRSIKLREVED